MPDQGRTGRTRDEYRPVDPKYVVVPGQGRPGGYKPSGPTLGDLLTNSVKQTYSDVYNRFKGIDEGTIKPNALDVVAGGIRKGVEETVKGLTWYDQHIWKPWTQVESSLLATIGTESKAAQGGDFYNPVDVWNKAWQASDRSTKDPLTPAQAALFTLQNLPVAKQILGWAAPDSAIVNDVFSESEREKYKTNPVLKYASGAMDFGNNIFGDPTVIGGKLIKTMRLAVSNPLVDIEKNIFRTPEQRLAFEAGAQERTAARQQADEAAQRVRDHDVAIADTVNQQLELKRQLDESLADPWVTLDPVSYDKQIEDLHNQWKILDEQRKVLIEEASKAQENLANVRSGYMPPASAGAQTFIDAIHDYGYSAHEIMHNYTLREFGTNAGTAASIIDAAAKLGDKTVTTDALRALTGDVNAYQRLYDKATVVHEMLRRAQGDLSHMNLHLDSMKNHGGDFAEYVADSQLVRDRISKEVDELILYDGFLREAIGDAGNPGAKLRRQFSRADAITDPLNSLANFVPGPAGDLIAKAASKLDQLPAILESARVGKSAASAALAVEDTIGGATAAWKSRTYQFHHLARPVVVLQWLGRSAGREVPHGWVVMHGIGSEDGAKELEAWLNSVPAWENKPDLKRQIMNDYITAGQVEHGKQSFIGDIRSRILHQTERQAFLDTAAMFSDKLLTEEQRTLLTSIQSAKANIEILKKRKAAGEDVKDELNAARKELKDLKNEWDTNHSNRVDWLTPTGSKDKFGNKQVIADTYWQMFQTKRAKQIKAVLSSRDEGTGRPGYWVDEDGKVVMVPVLDSQLEYSHPMLDIRVLHDAFKNATHEQLQSEIGIARTIGLGATDSAKAVLATGYTIFDRIWRPATLLRLGYTQRNVAEAWLRSISYFGHSIIAMAPFVKEGAAGWAQNRWSRWQQKIETVQQWKELMDEGVPVSSQPLYLWGNVKRWGFDLENSLAVQREQLNMMREGHGIMYDASIRSMESELADAKKLVRELKARAASGEDVAESLKAARSNVRSLTKSLRASKSTAAQALIDAQAEKVSRLEDTFRNFNTMLAKPGSKLNRVKSGDGEFAFMGHMIPEAYADTSGQVLRDMVSASTRANVDMNLQSVLSLEESRIVGSKARVYNPPNVKGLTAAEIKGDAEYFPALENFVHQLRNDTLAERMLEAFKTGADFDTQILESFSRGIKFLESAEGRAYVDRVKSIGVYDHEETPTTVALDRLTQLMDTSGQKQDLLVRFATDKNRILAPELRRDLFDNPHLKPVNGSETKTLREIQGEEGIGTMLSEMYRRFTERAFHYLGSLPEDTLVRHPFAQMVYMNHMRDQIANWEAQGGSMTQDIMDRLVNDARQLALKETRKTLYTITREKKIGSTKISKAYSPFIQAQMNSVFTWSRLLYQNPEAIGYLQQIWRNLDKLGTRDYDPQTGEQYITFQLPSFVADTVEHVSPSMANAIRTYGKWKFLKSGANLLFPGLRGNDIVTQAVQTVGVGPLVQIPIGRWLVDHPDIDRQVYNKIGIPLPVREVLSKFVPSDQLPREGSIFGSAVNAITPAWSRNVTAAVQQEESYRFAQTALMIAQMKMKEFIDDPKNSEFDLPKNMSRIYAEAEKEATAFMLVRANANLGLPIVPKYETALQPYVNMLREYQDKYGNQAGYAKFVEENPKLWFVNASLSSNVSGMDSTTLSVFLANKNQKLVTDLVKMDPKFVSMVTDTVYLPDVQARAAAGEDVAKLLAAGKFDTAANLWKRNQSQFVQKKNVQGALEDSQRAIGWVQYHRLNEAIDAVVKKNNMPSIQASPALMLYKRTMVYKLKRLYPEWGKDKDTLESSAWVANVQAAAKTAFNDKIINDTENYNHMKYVRAYFNMREQVTRELERRTYMSLQAGGVTSPTMDQLRGSALTIDSKNARDLRAIVDAYVSQLRVNKNFADFYDRWLDTDKFTFVEGIPE